LLAFLVALLNVYCVVQLHRRDLLPVDFADALAARQRHGDVKLVPDGLDGAGDTGLAGGAFRVIPTANKSGRQLPLSRKPFFAA
jgi:hypothetical protein